MRFVRERRGSSGTLVFTLQLASGGIFREIVSEFQ